VQENPTVEEQTSTAAALLPELQAITAAVQSVTGGLVQRQVAVSVDAPEVVDGVQEKVQELTLEIASTLNAVIAKVGLCRCFLFPIDPTVPSYRFLHCIEGYTR
jgi:hypothetical protein